MRDSIVMKGSTIGAGCVIDKAIIAEDVTIGEGTQVGVGEFAESKYDKKVYHDTLAVIGERSVVPAGVKIGRNTAISGVTELSDYHDGELASGDYIVKAGGM